MTATVVERYLDAIVAHDWDALTDLVTEDIVREGPYGDTYSGRADYVGYLRELMPALPGYSMAVRGVTCSGNRAFAELSETVLVNGVSTVTNEVIVVDLAGDVIRHISIYIQKQPS